MLTHYQKRKDFSVHGLFEVQEQTGEVFSSETERLLSSQAKQDSAGLKVTECRGISVRMSIVSGKRFTVLLLGWACPIQRFESYATEYVDRSTTVPVVFME